MVINRLAIKNGKKEIVVKGPHFIWPRITKKTERAVLKQLRKTISIYDNSDVVGRLESNLSKYFDADYALLTNSGTCALYSMYIGAGLKEGDEIIVPCYTFFATATPIFFTGATPVLADCRQDGNIDPKEILKKITNKTKAIVITHMWGLPCEMDEIAKIAREHNLLLLEDISHAFGASYNGKKVGSFGDAAACSLQSQKNVVGGEGGFVITNNKEIFYHALLLGHYNKRCKNEIPKDHKLSNYSLTGMGLKLRIHPLAAAIAEEQLSNLQSVISGREKFASWMIKEIGKIKGLEPIVPSKNAKSAWYALMIKYNKSKVSDISREKFHEAVVAEGATELDIPKSTCPLNLTKLFQSPGELFPNYKGKFSYKEGDFPIAEGFYNSTLKLPVWDRQKDKKIALKYIKSLKKVINNQKELIDYDKG